MIYFVETAKGGFGPADLAALGIAHIVGPGDGVSSRQTAQGPGGAAGLYVCNARVADLDQLEGLTWSEPLPGLPAAVRVGWATKPTPELLARREQLPGYWFDDVDGRRWRVPLVRRVDAAGTPRAATPCYLTFDTSGELVPGEPVAKYRYLSEVCDECWPRLDEFFRHDQHVAAAIEAGEDVGELGPRPPLPTADVLRWLSAIVATNYYASAQELVLLGVWSDVGLGPLSWLLAATSYDELLRREAAAEKKSPATVSSASDERCSTTTPGATGA